jgi:hypothetical protein
MPHHKKWKKLSKRVVVFADRFAGQAAVAKYFVLGPG